MATPNWANRTIFTGDNLYVMRGMNSESVDLIYADPPFNSNRTYSAPVGSKAAGAAFKDAWTLSDVDLIEHNRLREENKGLFAAIAAAKHTHSKGMFSYLVMMALRLIEMRRLLKPTGSIYLHCDPFASHYLRITMDSIFGRKNFRNEIIWCYEVGARSKSHFGRKHDTLLFYTKSDSYVFNADDVRLKRKKTHMKIEIDNDGREWQVKKDKKTGRIYRYPIDEGALCPDWWTKLPSLNRSAKERLGYPTQKPLALLQRVIKASSKARDIVFDPFAGCATTLIAAQAEGREWAGIDLSEKAVDLVKHRVRDLTAVPIRIHARADIPMRTDNGAELTVVEKQAHKAMLFVLQDQRCNGCNYEFPRPQDFHLDHIVARARGGTDHKENFQLLCGHYNSKKGAMPQEAFMASMAQSKATADWL